MLLTNYGSFLILDRKEVARYLLVHYYYLRFSNHWPRLSIMTLAKNIQTLFDTYTEKCQTQLHKNFRDLYRILEFVCQSPIEQYFLLNFISTLDLDFVSVIDDPVSQIAISLGHEIGGKTYTLRLFPQYGIKAEYLNITYHVDFLLMLQAVYYDPTAFLKINANFFCVAIEIDGHNFHERTKEQAARDKWRDREIQKAGYKLFRYTASEVYERSPQIVWELVDFLKTQRLDLAPKGHLLGAA